MPYKNKSDWENWERKHRPNRAKVRLEALNWVKVQISTAKEIGVKHTKEEWKAIRKALFHSRLKSATIDSLAVDATLPDRNK